MVHNSLVSSPETHQGSRTDPARTTPETGEHAGVAISVSPRPWRAPFAWGIAAVLGILLITRWSPARESEALWLRWFRTIADHPLRSALALGCLLHAACTKATGPRGLDPPAGDNQGPR